MAFRLNKKSNKKWENFSKRKSTCTLNPLQFSNMHHYYYSKVQMKHLRAKLACEFFVKMTKNIGMNEEVEKRDSWGTRFHKSIFTLNSTLRLKLNGPFTFCFPQNEKSFIPFSIDWIMLENFSVKWDLLHKTNGSFLNEVNAIKRSHWKHHLLSDHHHLRAYNC